MVQSVPQPTQMPPASLSPQPRVPGSICWCRARSTGPMRAGISQSTPPEKAVRCSCWLCKSTNEPLAQGINPGTLFQLVHYKMSTSLFLSKSLTLGHVHCSTGFCFLKVAQVPYHERPTASLSPCCSVF